jgi:hypothetical protein
LIDLLIVFHFVFYVSFSSSKAYDIHLSGCSGLNSLINGLWVQNQEIDLQHNWPFYTKENLFLYCNGSKWFISKELGGKSVYAFCEMETGNALKSRTPDGTTLWKVFDGKRHILEKEIVLERSYRGTKTVDVFDKFNCRVK